MPAFGVISPVPFPQIVVSIQNRGTGVIHITFGGSVQRGADEQRVSHVMAIAVKGMRA
jgi:hypothetical protein